MIQRTPDLIHALRFEFTFAASAPDSLALADWVKADLLPVIEEVLDQQRATGRRRRIERLQIDLGSVSAEQAHGELARRLSVQLSEALDKALDEALDEAGAAEAAVGSADGPGAPMLQFLRSGTVPWSAAWDTRQAHSTLLQELINSAHAHAVLSLALNDAGMLTRLIRQYDTQQLLAAAEVLFAPWPEPERAAALAWGAGELARLQAAGAQAESFWRWFLAQGAHPASAQRLQAGWSGAMPAAPRLPGSASVPALPGLSAEAPALPGFSAEAAEAIGQGLARADFSLLAPYWDRLLASAPQYLRSAHPRLWQRWLDHFDADTLVDILGVTQADCAWLIECLANVVPRARLNALLRPAIPQWLSVAVDSLAPQLVVEWVMAALPEQSGRIAALFAATDAVGEPACATAVRPGDPVRHLDPVWPPVAPVGDTASAHAAARVGRGSDATFSAAEAHAIQQGLETADFTLLTPYWNRIVASAPQWLRSAHPQRWRQWLDHFDDATLTDILGVVQPGCAAWIGALETSVTRPRLDALLRPAMGRWLAAPVDSLAPRQVLEWLAVALPEYSGAIPARRSTHESAPEGEQADPAAAATSPTFTPAQLRTIALGLETADFTLLAPFWERIVSDAPQCLRSAHARRWQQWLDHFDDAALADILGVVQPGCAAWIGALATSMQRSRVGALLRPAMGRWLAAPVDSLAPRRLLEWLAVALPEPVPALRGTHESAQEDQQPEPAPAAAGANLTAAEMRSIGQGLETAAPAERLAPQGTLERLAGSVPDQSGRMLALAAPEMAIGASHRHAPALAAGLSTLRQSDRQLLSTARALLRAWPEEKQEAVLAWAANGLASLRAAGTDSAAFWRWFLTQCASPIEVADLARRWSTEGDRAPDAVATAIAQPAPAHQRMPDAHVTADTLDASGDDAVAAAASLHAALGEPLLFARLVRALDGQQLLAAARVLFNAWSPDQRNAVLAWAAAEQQRLHEGGADAVAFWRWLLPQHGRPATHEALAREHAMLALSVPAAPSNAHAPDVLFTPEVAAAIEQGLATAQFHLLAPHWERLLAHAPQRIIAVQPRLWRSWLAAFDDVVLIDILSVVQPDCKPMLEQISALISRAHLLPLVRPALQAWLGAAPQRLSPRAILMHVMQAAPQHADALAALYQPSADSARAARGRHGAVDSEHFRQALRVLGPIFARGEIITISKCLNAGQFGPLAPYWDRLLVLAPHWLRSEYPRLAPTWVAGFDDEVLIDILSVVQSECCALIERLASSLPRERLHAALRPSLARWFDIGLDRLTPQAVMAEIQSATHALAGHPAMTEFAARASWQAIDAASLEQLLQGGDVDQLRRQWPSILMSQRASLRGLWQRLPGRQRGEAIDLFTRGLSRAQRADVALIVQPAAAGLLAELQQWLAERHDGAAILDSAVQVLLQGDVASLVPAQFMQAVLERHGTLAADLAPGAPRHIAAALQACAGAPEEQGDRLVSARLSPAAWRAYVADCQRADPQFAQLNCAQLHGLVQSWAGFQQPGAGGGAFVSSVEVQALRAAVPHAFFGKVLQQAMLGASIDLDDIGAQSAVNAAAPIVLPAPCEEVVARTPLGKPDPSPLPESLCRALPQRLAAAMLRSDLSALDALWPAIVTHHAVLLEQAARRYLGGAQARKRLIASADVARMLDLLGCLSPRAAQLVAPLLDRAARFGMTLPAALAPAALRQNVLCFAFEQVLARPAASAPVEWISGLLRSILPPSHGADADLALVAHAWYELLRGSDSPLKDALEETLFGRAYLKVEQLRLHSEAGGGLDASLPEVLQQMLTMELCNSHPALTDHLLEDGSLANAEAVFSTAEWYALARAQLPRQPRETQEAFWREYAACLPAPASHGSEEDVQAAFAAAFGILAAPVRLAEAVPATMRGAPAGAGVDTLPIVLMREHAPDQVATAAAFGILAVPVRLDDAVPATVRGAPAGAGVDTLAILLMRERAPDQVATASITLLMQRLLAAADTGAGANDHATLRSALSHPRALARLLDILPAPTLARALCVLRPDLASALPAVLRALGDTMPIPRSAVPATLDIGIWRAVFEAIFIGPPPAGPDALLAVLTRTMAGERPPETALQAAAATALAAPAAAATPAQAMALLLQPLAGPPPEQPAARALPGDEQALPFSGDANLRNAGLVIVAPYIERLFALLDITRDGAFISDETRQRGVHLLQYVVSAEESTPEYLLALNKLLCGIPAAVPVIAGISMSQKEKDTVEQMLKGVIAHWSAIGSSSVTGLRETFLQREGCLYYEEEAWHLNVPQRTFDMLLDRLPWGYKLIKFSWMAAPLNVVWR